MNTRTYKIIAVAVSATVVYPSLVGILTYYLNLGCWGSIIGTPIAVLVGYIAWKTIAKEIE